MGFRIPPRQPIFMPYSDPKERASYAKEWSRRVTAERKGEWFKLNGPCKCGSWENLEVHHLNPKEKVSHKVWHWRQDRRNQELSKCVPVCSQCHKDITKQYVKSIFTCRNGFGLKWRKHSKETAVYILQCLANGETQRGLAKRTGINRTTISHLSIGYKYKDVVEDFRLGKFSNDGQSATGSQADSESA